MRLSSRHWLPYIFTSQLTIKAQLVSIKFLSFHVSLCQKTFNFATNSTYSLTMSDGNVLHEITPLMEQDALYIADRIKKEFSYPVHNHDVFELNFVEHAAGVKRIVGDSSEVIGEYDLVLITSPILEHAWEQHQCVSEEIREITIQFQFGMGDNDLFFAKTPFAHIKRMMLEARKGLSFPMPAIMRVYDKLDTLSKVTDRFTALMQFLEILNTLSHSEGARTLSTSSYAKVELEDDSRRILKVKKYINDNYMHDLRLKTLADVGEANQLIEKANQAEVEIMKIVESKL